MFFRNVTLFRFPTAAIASAHAFEDALKEHWLRDVGPMEISTSGFVPVLPGGDVDLTRCFDKCVLFCLGEQEKLLPSIVVSTETRERVDEIEEREARRVGSREHKQIREAVISDLLPRAFVKPRRTMAYIDTARGWLVVDTASRKQAEKVVDALRGALGRFPAIPVAAENSPRTLMTDWLIHGKTPEGFAFGDECELADPAEAGAKWNGRRTDLETDDVREHLRSGMQAFKLGVVYDERLSFVLGEDLAIRKLKFLDVLTDELGEPESAETEWDAKATLMTLEFARLIDTLDSVFGLPQPESFRLGQEDAPTPMKIAAVGDELARKLADLDDEQFRTVMDAALARDPGNLAAIKKVREARDAGKALDDIAHHLSLDAGVRKALRKLVSPIGKHGIDSITIGSPGHESVTITAEDAENIRRNTRLAAAADRLKGDA